MDIGAYISKGEQVSFVVNWSWTSISIWVYAHDLYKYYKVRASFQSRLSSSLHQTKPAETFLFNQKKTHTLLSAR